MDINNYFYILAIVSIALGALAGFRKGALREGFKLVGTGIAIGIIAIILGNIYKSIVSYFESEPIVPLLERYGVSLDENVSTILSSLHPETLAYIIAIPVCLIIIPILAILLYFVLKILLWIPLKLIRSLVPDWLDLGKGNKEERVKKSKKDKESRKDDTVEQAECELEQAEVEVEFGETEGEFEETEAKKGKERKKKAPSPLVIPNSAKRAVGAVFGAVNAFLILGLLLFPATGLVEIADAVIEHAEEQHSDLEVTADAASFYDEYLGVVSDNIVFKACAVTYAPLHRSLTDINVEGENVHIKDIAIDLSEIYLLYEDMGGGSVDFKHLTEEQRNTVSEMIYIASSDRYTGAILSDVVRVLAENVDTESLGIEEDNPVISIVEELLSVFRTTNVETFEDDIRTLLDILFTVSNAGLFDEDPDIEHLFVSDHGEETAAHKIIDILEENPRYNGICRKISEVAIQMIIDNSDFDTEMVEEVKHVVDNMKGALTDIIELDKNSYTEDEYRDQVITEMKGALTESGIDLDGIEMTDEDREEIETIIADAVIENLDEVSEVSDAELIDVLLGYYEKYKDADFSKESVDP